MLVKLLISWLKKNRIDEGGIKMLMAESLSGVIYIVFLRKHFSVEHDSTISHTHNNNLQQLYRCYEKYFP